MSIIKLYTINFCLLLTAFVGFSQKPEQKMLLLTPEMEILATEAINNMYNFKFDKAEKRFLEIRQDHIDHPLPYFLMGMSNWWKMLPYDDDDDSDMDKRKVYEEYFLAYMDSSIVKAENYYEKEETKIEAAFFLSAAYGLTARYHAEKRNKLKTIFPTKNALKYFKETHDNNALSPEFMFGSGLMNYYGAWFREEYPMLRPLLALFPKGDKELGIKQLDEVAHYAFYTRTEGQYFLMKIYFNEEDRDDLAYPYAKYLATTFPDNPYFQRILLRLSYSQGYFSQAEEISYSILYKISIGMPGYESNSGRTASYVLGYRHRYHYRDKVKAKEYYQKSVIFAEKCNATKMGYYLTSVAELARMADEEKDFTSAKLYYKTVLDNSERKNKLHQEAKDYLRKKKN